MGAGTGVIVHCPICKHDHEALTPRIVNVCKDDELKRKFEKGEQFHYQCPDCGYNMILEYSFMYEDPDIREYIYLSQERPSDDGYDTDQIAKNAASMAEGKTEDALLRIVYSEKDLREKIKIFENGLDDRVVEFCKGTALSQFPSTDEYFVTDIHYDNIAGQELLKLICSDGTEQYVLNFTDMYNLMVHEYGAMLPPLRGNVFLCIDLEYAAAFLRELEK